MQRKINSDGGISLGKITFISKEAKDVSE
uniref:Uncharacterized protein n=1 Tax=Nelumbo nucifera TaxID=4432 RepID=A0A822XZA5_NELNU|nr:TPA_asm: hypothetical protein HUJ06_025790 [Nelumbo nucifera]